MKYSNKQYKALTMKDLAEKFHTHLMRIIDHCSAKGQANEKEYTPSDFGDQTLSMDDLQQIMDQVD